MRVRQILQQHAPDLGITLSETQLDAFETYSRELIVWNQKINLTRITDPTEIAVKHFLDSLSIHTLLPQTSPLALIDIGSGAGFPGLPLKIVRPEIRLTLVEATQKKTLFLQHIVDTLQLAGTSVYPMRAEEVGQQPTQRARYDVVTARAVAPLSVLAEYMLPLVKTEGIIIAQKGQNSQDEIETAHNALSLLGGQLIANQPVSIPALEAERHLIIIKKVTPTPDKYPRRAGLPSKRPL